MITNMEELFIPYQQALDLKELGFDEPCFAYFYHHIEHKIIFDNPALSRDYNSIKIDVGSIFDHDKERIKKGLEILGDSVSRMTSIPIYSQVFKWFRDKHKLIPNIHSIYEDETLTEIKFWFWFGNHKENDSEEEVFYGTYEEAELECLKQLIKLIKNER